jgi:hypothetical protein
MRNRYKVGSKAKNDVIEFQNIPNLEGTDINLRSLQYSKLKACNPKTEINLTKDVSSILESYAVSNGR